MRDILTLNRRGILGLAALTWTLLLGMPGTALAQQAPTVKVALLSFEDGVSWDAVSPRWHDQRAAWIAAVQAARSPAELAQQMLRLEGIMGWPAVNEGWRTRRAGWLAEVAAVQTEADFAHHLLELEAATRWTAVRDVWRQRRTAWVASLQAVH